MDKNTSNKSDASLIARWKHTKWVIIEPKVYEKPSEGIHDLQILEFVEKKDVETEFGVRDRVQVIFEVLDEQGTDGQNLKLSLVLLEYHAPFMSALAVKIDDDRTATVWWFTDNFRTGYDSGFNVVSPH